MTQVKKFIDKRTHRTFVNTGKLVTLIGALSGLFGLTLIGLVSLFGEWIQQPRRLKKAM